MSTEWIRDICRYDSYPSQIVIIQQPPIELIMKSFIASLILAIICLASSTSAFSVRPSSVVSTTPVSAALSPTSLNVFGKRKTKAQLEEEAEIAAQYWAGEWVCKDCGYIYNRVSCCRKLNGTGSWKVSIAWIANHLVIPNSITHPFIHPSLSFVPSCCWQLQQECAGMFFEEQGAGFRCPQCSGPRRRYAKKVGDRVGTTLDGGDAPILIFSFGGVALTIAFGVWAINNL